MNYKKKYLKYKKKYINLKQSAGLKNSTTKNRNNWVELCGIPKYNVIGKDYLKGVNIDENVKTNILQRLFLYLPQGNKRINLVTLGYKGNFSGSLNKVYEEIDKLNKVHNKVSWIKCENKCYKTLKKLIDIELKSTAYIIRALSNSVLQPDNSKLKLEFVVELKEKLNGIWENDKKYINIKELEKNKKARLIMGLGPSASGKTYWAKSIIKMLSRNNFPNAFLSIDGGIYREQSVMYQIIIKSINSLCNKKILGFSNLFTSIHGLFKTPKNTIYKYLKEQSNKKIKISLYVPETMGKCLVCRISSKQCICGNDIVKKYNKIANDKNWIGLFIWQHKLGSRCPFDINFKCKGTTNSGKSRELTEGKRYSSKAYEISFHGGLTLMKSSPGGRIEIHNGGGLKIGDKFTKSIIKEYKIKSKNNLLKDIEFSKSENVIYVDDKFDMKHEKIFF